MLHRARAVLRQLAIRNVVLVEQLGVEFDEGLGVLTGETGWASRSFSMRWALRLARDRTPGWSASGQDGASVAAEIELPPIIPSMHCSSSRGSRRITASR